MIGPHRNHGGDASTINPVGEYVQALRDAGLRVVVLIDAVFHSVTHTAQRLNVKPMLPFVTLVVVVVACLFTTTRAGTLFSGREFSSGYGVGYGGLSLVLAGIILPILLYAHGFGFSIFLAHILKTRLAVFVIVSERFLALFFLVAFIPLAKLFLRTWAAIGSNTMRACFAFVEFAKGFVLLALGTSLKDTHVVSLHIRLTMAPAVSAARGFCFPQLYHKQGGVSSFTFRVV